MSELSEQAMKLYEAVKKRPRDVYYGQRGWTPDRLPKGVRREHFDELLLSGLVTIRLGQLIALDVKTTQE